MKIATAWSTSLDSAEAMETTIQQLKQKLGALPHALILHASAAYDCATLVATLHAEMPDIPMFGSTSCFGVMTEEGFHSKDGMGLGLMGLLDEEGCFGVGVAFLEDSPKEAAIAATQQALTQAQQIGAMPSMIWVSAAPGTEEEVLAGIDQMFGGGVPIAGGSAADNEVMGHWKLFANGQVYENAVVVMAMFLHGDCMFSFHSGYEPTQYRGKATKCKGRILYEIDGRPAAEVYDRWTQGQLSQHLAEPGNILAKTTLYPLGRTVGQVGGVPYYQLSHPDSVLAAGALTMFTDINEGDELLLMHGTPDSLASRAGRVARAALNNHQASPEHVAGALVIYCAGCMLTIQSRMDEVCHSLYDTLQGKPFLGAFTFGEQGCFVGGENRHGNLMISVLLFEA